MLCIPYCLTLKFHKEQQVPALVIWNLGGIFNMPLESKCKVVGFRWYLGEMFLR